MPADPSIYGLQQAPRINTPFENLAQVLAVRNQQENQRALAEQRRAVAQQTDERTKMLQQQQADVAAIDAAGMDLSKLPQHLRPVVEKQLRESDEWNEKVKKAKFDAEQAELGYAAHLANGVLYWEKDGPEAMLNAAQTALQVAKAHGHDVSQIETALQNDPAQLKPMLESIIARHQGPQAPVKPPQTVSPGQGVLNPATGKYDVPIPVPEKITYGAPQTQMVGGKRTLVRAGSDGRMYDMNLKPIDAAAIAPEPDKGTKPTYEWANVNGKNEYLTPEEIRAKGGTKPMTAMEAIDERKYKKAAPVLASISELSEKINTNQGVYAKMAGGAARLAAKANLDDDVAEYDALVSGFTPMVARALGHTGVLTQQDVDSVKKLFPSPGDSKSLRDRKMKRVMDIIGELEGATNAPAKPVGSKVTITSIKEIK